VLVVVVSAALLGYLAIQWARYAHAASNQTKCVANLKLLGEACKMYQADWHDVLVPYGAPFTWDHQRGAIWPQLLEPYLRQISRRVSPNTMINVLCCPAVPAEEQCFCPAMHYGMNRECGGWMPGGKPVVVSLRKVAYPHATVMIAEATCVDQGGTLFAAKPSEFKPND